MARSLSSDEFLITAPEAQPGVVLQVEPGVRPVMLLEPYSADTDVHCAFCRQRQLHKNGYLALLPDGSRALCGNVCAEEFFDKMTVAALDRKREQLASARVRRQYAEAIIGTAANLLPVIDDDIAPNEWEAEAAMVELAEHLNAAVIQQIRSSDVQGVEFLGQPCRAFGDARGGIAAIVRRADGMTEREAEKLLEKRAVVIERLEHGTRYLRAAASFFQRSNLIRFRDWMLAHGHLHDITAIKVAKDQLALTREMGKDWWGKPNRSTFAIDIPDIEAPEFEHLMGVLSWQQQGQDPA